MISSRAKGSASNRPMAKTPVIITHTIGNHKHPTLPVISGSPHKDIHTGGFAFYSIFKGITIGFIHYHSCRCRIRNILSSSFPCMAGISIISFDAP